MWVSLQADGVRRVDAACWIEAKSVRSGAQRSWLSTRTGATIRADGERHPARWNRWTLIILLAGGDKRTQDADVRAALRLALELSE